MLCGVNIGSTVIDLSLWQRDEVEMAGVEVGAMVVVLLEMSARTIVDQKG